MKDTLRIVAGAAFFGVLTTLIAGCGPAAFKPETKGSEETINKVKSGQPMYTPPQGVPGIPGGGGAGMPPMAPPSGGKAP